MTHWDKSALAVAVIAVAGLLSGCSSSEADALAEARQAIDKNDLKSAAIQLKNVLSENPSSPAARVLMGKTLLQGGNAPGAEVELRKAKELGAQAAEWAPMLARAMLLQRRYKPVVEEFADIKLPDSTAQADLSASVAAALAGDGRIDQARALIESTLAGNPDHPATLMLKARMLARPGSLDEAIALVEKVIAAHPQEAEAWLLSGDLQLYGKRDLPKALAAYRKVLELRNESVQAFSSIIFVHLAANDLASARKQLDAMRKTLPGHPQTIFRDAHVSFLSGDSLRARELIQQLLRKVPDNIAWLELAGAIELKLNSLAQAETHLNKVLSQSPDSPAARRMLADALIRGGKPGKALEVLRPNIERPTPDPLSLSLSAEAHLQTGNYAKAESLFQQAAKIAPTDTTYRTAVALTQLARGHGDSALSELRTIAASEPGTLADLTLISALMRRNQIDDALSAIDELEKKQPDKPQAANLRGRAFLMKRDLVSARKSFELALSKDPIFLPAVSSLAAIDMVEGKPDQAEQRYKELLKVDPKSTQAYVALARIKVQRGGNKEEVRQLLEQAVLSNPSDPAPRQFLIEHLVASRDMKAALSAAQAGVAALPDNAEMLESLGIVQVLTGEPNQGISTFGKIVAKYPTSPRAHLRMADVYLQNRDFASAERSFRRALELQPDSVRAQRGIIALSVRDKKPERALEVARSMQAQRPSDAIGYMLEGDIHVEFKKLDLAIKAYRGGLEKSNSRRLAERLYAALTVAKGQTEGLRFADDWIKRHPNDIQFLVFLGSNAINSNNLPLAERFFGDAIKISPNNASATNNLAWVMAKMGKPGAVALAEKAVALSPEDPAMLDTLAFAFAADGQLAKAVNTGKAVIIKAPDEPVYRLNLAKLYLRGGNNEAARTELKQLALLGNKFARQSEVTSLLKELPSE